MKLARRNRLRRIRGWAMNCVRWTSGGMDLFLGWQDDGCPRVEMPHNMAELDQASRMERKIKRTQIGR